MSPISIVRGRRGSSSGGGGGGGSGITLNSAGLFGTKGNLTPAVWDTYEDITPYEVFNASVGTTIGSMQNMQGTSNAYQGVSTDNPHSGTRSAKIRYPASTIDKFPNLGCYFSSSSNEDAYHSGWYYFGGSGYINIPKCGRIGSDPTDPYNGRPMFYNTVGVWGGVTDIGYVGSAAAGTQLDNSVTSAYWTPNSYHFVEWIYRLSTPGGTDGFVKEKVDGQVTVNATGLTTRSNTAPYNGRGLAWAICPLEGASGCAGDGENQVYGDEILFDASLKGVGALARVIITDSSTYVYSTSTKRANQPITSWSASTIQIDNPFRGNIAQGTAVWAHVWDADDNYIGAYSIPGGMP